MKGGYWLDRANVQSATCPVYCPSQRAPFEDVTLCNQCRTVRHGSAYWGMVIPIYNLHATFASRLAVAGVPDFFISEIMGHAGGFLQTYAKAIKDYHRDSICKLEAFRESANMTSALNLPSKSLVH
jgi:hypothetical protein